MKSGFVPVVGRPNVGKSTLVNALVGQKVAITSTRPQTTRNAIRGVLTLHDGDDPFAQVVFVDTPGLHRPRTELGNRLNGLVYGTLAEADVVVFVIDATQPIGPGDRRIAERLGESGAQVVVVVNKTDTADRNDVASQLAEAAGWDFAAYVPLSALDASNLEPLVDEIVLRLPDGPLYFAAGEVSDQPEHVLVAEIVREKFLERLREELPHSLVVMTEEMETRDDGLLWISARVVVERRSQRGIVIGKGGVLLRDAGTEARIELESIFGTRVHLDLRVRVEPEWQSTPELLDRLGFEKS
ncbi:MAG TPA: GTPase Era [Acidimicrobiia bacterium]|nr:GTPase Era [Acidimicrobiia bacterium]